MQLYLDCDGVLADFLKGAADVLGMPLADHKRQHGESAYWKHLARVPAPGFFAILDELPDARALFDGVKHLSPVILTGCPWGGWAEAQKDAWGAAHFPGTKVISCMPRDKRLHCKPGDILVDDTLTWRHLWEQAGGIFVHHESAEKTLAELRRLLPDAFPPPPAAPRKQSRAAVPVP